MSKTVLVTGIGGNVGEGILRNIISFDKKIYLVGTNTTLIAGGSHLCDKVYQVPFSTKASYIPTIKKICLKEKVDLIIPSTDYEVYYLGLAKKKLPQIACTKPAVSRIFLNKYLNAKFFKERGIPFASTYLPSHYKKNHKDIIVKPICGRGSREICRNPKNVNSFSDRYIIQKYYRGEEITAAFYVKKDSKLHGFIVFKRTLLAGATDQCEVVFRYNNQINKLIQNIMKNFEIRGSCNIQAIVTRNRKIIPFELNCRISGTNSIRANFGFEDVRYTLEECLYDKKPAKSKIKKGSAVRFLKDVIYPNIGLREIRDKNTKHYLF